MFPPLNDQVPSLILPSFLISLKLLPCHIKTRGKTVRVYIAMNRLELGPPKAE